MKQSLFDWLIVFVCIACLSCGDNACADGRCPEGDLNQDCRVDLPDLVIFSSQWLDGWQGPQQGLETHWKLDEDGGLIAADSTTNGYTGELLNGPVWQPTGGMLGGALEFDGADDFIAAPFVLNPAEGPLSVFAWVNGGASQEVIITQTNDAGGGVGREWLQIDPAGTLVTRLTDGMSKLACDVIITDGRWHHVGVVWDGSRRYLYVDGAEAARDPLPLDQLQGCTGAMYIGAGKTLAGYMFWSGLIDDVRIYARAVGPDEIAAMAEPPVTPGPGDANLNGRDGVDFADFAILAYNWMAGPPGEYRCIWVDIWDPSVRTASQCDALVQLCRNYNINTVMPEIRVYGDAYYESNLEPRSSRIPVGGFDPLGYLIDKAHDTSGGKKYIEVHAWFVMQRMGTTSTSLDPQHVLSQHWEYVMRDSSGNTGSTLYLDPGHPGALDHNVAVILDCLSNYDIDGINLDYIRYPGSVWGYNPVSIDRFNAFYGKNGQPSLSDPDWSDWRRECTTHQVKKVYVKSLMIDPDVVITADTINWGSNYSENNYTSSSAYAGVFQDWVGWLQEGIIDYNAFMNYVGNNPVRYNGWTDLSLANDDKRGSIIGIGAYMQPTVQDAMDQLLYARNQGAAGLNIYDWGGEVNANTIGETANDFYRELKAQLYPEWVDPPVHEWKVRPAKGIFEGYVSASGVPVDHAAVEIEGDPSTRVYTDGSGWYAILETPPGEHRLRFSKLDYDYVVSAPTMLTAGQIKTVNADLWD